MTMKDAGAVTLTALAKDYNMSEDYAQHEELYTAIAELCREGFIDYIGGNMIELKGRQLQ